MGDQDDTRLVALRFFTQNVVRFLRTIRIDSIRLVAYSVEVSLDGTIKNSLKGEVLAVCAGGAGELSMGSRTIDSAFVKSELSGAVHVSTLGIDSDEHVYEDHGGPDMALLVYSIEHYDYWRSLGIDLPSCGAMAENLTVRGLVETDVMIGDQFRVGTVVAEVSQPRSPCYKIAARFGRKDLPVLVQETGFTGYLMRVLQPGSIAAGDSMELVGRTGANISVADAGRVVNVDRNDREAIRRVLEEDALGASVRRKLEARLTSPDVGIDSDRLFL
jgi:MOSC domain-containing protein YiiM